MAVVAEATMKLQGHIEADGPTSEFFVKVDHNIHNIFSELSFMHNELRTLRSRSRHLVDDAARMPDIMRSEFQNGRRNFSILLTTRFDRLRKDVTSFMEETCQERLSEVLRERLAAQMQGTRSSFNSQRALIQSLRDELASSAARHEQQMNSIQCEVTALRSTVEKWTSHIMQPTPFGLIPPFFGNTFVPGYSATPHSTIQPDSGALDRQNTTSLSCPEPTQATSIPAVNQRMQDTEDQPYTPPFLATVSTMTDDEGKHDNPPAMGSTRHPAEELQGLHSSPVCALLDHEPQLTDVIGGGNEVPTQEFTYKLIDDEVRNFWPEEISRLYPLVCDMSHDQVLGWCEQQRVHVGNFTRQMKRWYNHPQHLHRWFFNKEFLVAYTFTDVNNEMSGRVLLDGITLPNGEPMRRWPGQKQLPLPEDVAQARRARQRRRRLRQQDRASHNQRPRSRQRLQRQDNHATK